MHFFFNQQKFFVLQCMYHMRQHYRMWFLLERGESSGGSVVANNKPEGFPFASASKKKLHAKFLYISNLLLTHNFIFL